MNSEKSQKFSGWRVLVGCFIVMFVAQGALQTFSVFLPSLVADTGYTVGQLAIMSTFATGGAFIASMFVGPLINKIGVKWTIFLGGVSAVIHWFASYKMNSLTSIYITGALGGLVVAFATMGPCSVVINNWFIKNRATYMSIIVAASMFGGTLLLPLSGKLIEMIGWRKTYLVFTIVFGGIIILASLFLIIGSPEDVGQKPYGYDEIDKSKDDEKKRELPGVSASEARRTPAFWLLIVGIMAIAISTQSENFLPSHWQSLGMDVGTSSNLMGVYSLIAAVAVLLLGRVTDKMGGRIYTVLTSILFVIGILAIIFSGGSTIILITLSTVPFAVGGKKVATLTPSLLVEETFGPKDYDNLIGTYTGLFQLGFAISNVIIGQLFDATGSYKIPFMLMAIINVLGTASILIALKITPYKESLDSEFKTI